jgi:hypothetical protein
VRQVTLAPELPGGIDAVRRFVAGGVAVAVGHTNATEDEASAAFDAGATLLTHAFNAMPGIHHRAPGPIVAAMRDERVTLELIADGFHVHPDVIALAFAGAPGRIALITDAMAAAGAPTATTSWAGCRARHRRQARLVENGAIAGSTLTQDAALRLVVAAAALADAVAAVTAYPRGRSAWRRATARCVRAPRRTLCCSTAPARRGRLGRRHAHLTATNERGGGAPTPAAPLCPPVRRVRVFPRYPRRDRRGTILRACDRNAARPPPRCARIPAHP